MSDTDKKIPKNQSTKDTAINHKGNEADGKEINHQQQNKKEIHQPRDNA